MDTLVEFLKTYQDAALSFIIMAFFLNYFVKLSEKQWKYCNDEIKAREEKYTKALETRDDKYAQDLKERDMRYLRLQNRVVLALVTLADAIGAKDPEAKANTSAMLQTLMRESETTL